jgi:hypothetical protein
VAAVLIIAYPLTQAEHRVHEFRRVIRRYRVPTWLEHTEHRANGPVFPIDDSDAMLYSPAPGARPKLMGKIFIDSYKWPDCDH